MKKTDLENVQPIPRELGWFEENGENKYLLGNNVVTSEGIEQCEEDRSESSVEPYRFVYDALMTAEESVVYVLCLIDLLPEITFMLLGNFIAGLLYPLFKSAGARPKYAMCIVSKPASLKTTMGLITSSFYKWGFDEDACKITLTSSLPSVEKKIHELRNATAVFDDFFAEVEGKQENMLRSIIRSLSEGCRETKGHEKYTFETTAVITAEKILTDTSTLNRMVVVLMREVPNMKLLFELNENRLALPTFVLHFLQWACQNYTDIVLFIRSEFRRHREKGGAQPYLRYERARDNCFVIETGIKILMRYTYSSGAIDAPRYSRYINFAESVISRTFALQNTLQNTNQQPNEIDLVTVIADLYFSGQLNIKSFEKAKTKIVLGFVNFKKNALCLDPTQLTEFIRRSLNNYGITSDEIGHQLDQRGMLLKCCDDKRAMQFTYAVENEKGKTVNAKHRYFFVNLAELTKYVNRSAFLFD